MKQQLCLISVVFCGTLMTGCHTLWSTEPKEPEKTNYDILADLTADKSCDASYQCKVLEVGERLSCEGPSQYLIYSIKRTNEQKIAEVAAQITAQEHKANLEKAPQSSCQQVLPVIPLCIKQTCQSYIQ
ncbi:hypothetical protein [Pseudoalteromonas byunsanensis]|uniref:Lipoprotein n=1 Tax=Pseudoalteromonas byunsanensis TaxID=327939 RepID=A0A1S1NEH7_9GAMM|nr:hypothetical protein [Pseudoalteromonas byunsanensis]OHU98015.1 hypothetical protein BIW53_00365 [Pseudoalteromonas byunsanensis]